MAAHRCRTGTSAKRQGLFELWTRVIEAQRRTRLLPARGQAPASILALGAEPSPDAARYGLISSARQIGKRAKKRDQQYWIGLIEEVDSLMEQTSIYDELHGVESEVVAGECQLAEQSGWELKGKVEYCLR